MKKIVLSAPFWVLIVAAFCIAFGAIRIAVIYNRPDRDMASVWSQGSEMSYRHMAVFGRGARQGGESTPPLYIDEKTSIRKSDIITIRTALQSVVDAGRGDRKNAGLAEDGSPKFWEDCYSTWFNDTVELVTIDTTVTRPSVSAEIVAVGGNYKAFHPFEYMSGGFLSDNCVDPNQVVINDVLAWRFFHSYDVIGNKIYLLGEEFTISGVVREYSSSIDNTAGVSVPRCYIYFSALETYYLTTDDEEGSYSSDVSVAISCYEAMLPELVSGVAIADFQNALPNYNAADPTFYVVDVTDRYKINHIWDYMMPIGETDAKLSAYELPFWEVAGNLTTLNLFVCALVFIFGIVLLLIGIIMIVLRFRKLSRSEDIS